MAEITKIEKLNGKNDQSWKYNIKLVLMERGLWGFIAGTETAPAETATVQVRNAYRLRSDKAYSLIALSVERVYKCTLHRRQILELHGKRCKNNSNLFPLHKSFD